MKNSKILIFILAIILLIVVIMFMKGFRSKEGFYNVSDLSKHKNLVKLLYDLKKVANWSKGFYTSEEDLKKLGLRKNAYLWSHHEAGSDNEVLDNHAIKGNINSSKIDDIIEFIQKFLTATNSDINDIKNLINNLENKNNKDDKDDKWWSPEWKEWPQDLRDKLNENIYKGDRIPKEWMLINNEKRTDDNIPFEQRMQAINKFFKNYKEANLQGKTISDVVFDKWWSSKWEEWPKELRDELNNNIYKSDRIPKEWMEINSDIKQDGKADNLRMMNRMLAINKFFDTDANLQGETIATLISKISSISDSIDSINSKINNIEIPSINGLLNEDEFNKYKETQKDTDLNQDTQLNSFIKNQYADKTKYLEDLIKKYKSQGGNALENHLQDYNLHVMNFDDLKNNVKEDKENLQDHLTKYDEYKKGQEQKDSSQDTALSNWENIFKSSQVNLGIRIKCQNKDTGEWGKTAGEFCPDWFKASLPN